MKFLLKILFIFSILVFISCSPENKSNNSSKTEVNSPYIKEYSGGYTIEIKGVNSDDVIEVYILSDNGKAKWLWIENENGEAITKSKKTGSWNAIENKIEININGNTGLITEEYILINNVFVNTLSDIRYLKKNE